MPERLTSKLTLKLLAWLLILTRTFPFIRIADRNVAQLTEQPDTVEIILRVQLRHFVSTLDLKPTAYITQLLY